MSETPARPSRRVASRRKIIVESDDEEADIQPKIEENSEEDFTPAPIKSPKKAPATRRRTTNTAAPATKPVRRSRKIVAQDNVEPPKVMAKENIEPSEIFDPEASMQVDSESPSKKTSPRKRSAPTSRKPRTSAVAELLTPIATPKVSASPEPSLLREAPLADITDSINERPQSSGSQSTVSSQSMVKPINPMDTVLERPMDIVLKSRSTATPVVEDTGPKARIVITYLILTNFKSYAGRQEVGPFHSSFSSVVGPNGSGKSNVIDSLLFVFGFRASKMRQGKISALIHNSAAHPDLDFCEVAVQFQEIMDQVSCN